jgi:hypothetical protein
MVTEHITDGKAFGVRVSLRERNRRAAESADTLG